MAPRFLLAGLALHLVSCGIDMDGIAGAFQRPSAVVELDKTVDLGKATVLRLDTSNGRIKVRSGGEEIELHVKVSLSAGTQEAADAAAPQVAITESVVGDRLEFNVDLPEGTKLGGASYDVTCPLGMSLDLHTTNGRVEVEGPFPSVTVDTSNGSINSRNAFTLCSLPVTSMIIDSAETSMILARKMSQIWITSARLVELTFTLSKMSSRPTASVPTKAFTSMTSINLSSCLTQSSSALSSPLSVVVMRERCGSTVGPTLSVSMLKPRPLNMPAMRANTPNLFSTKTEMTCFMLKIWNLVDGTGLEPVTYWV